MPAPDVTLLLIEDTQNDADLLRIALRQLPFVITHVTTVGEAVDLLKKDPGAFDLVLSDMNLPDSSGLDTVRAIAPLHPAVVVLTSNDHQDWYIVVRLGADDFVPKSGNFKE